MLRIIEIERNSRHYIAAKAVSLGCNENEDGLPRVCNTHFVFELSKSRFQSHMTLPSSPFLLQGFSTFSHGGWLTNTPY